MRIVSLLIVLLAFSLAWAQEEEKESPQPEQQKMPAAFEDYPILKRMWSNIPPTLAEAHTELERLLPPETLAEIDAMSSEKDMIKYHFSWGLNMRNGWGLWAGSPLAKHLQELGFTHPDAMSGVILATFWRKRHGQDLNLEELKAAAKKAAEAAEKAQGENEMRLREARVTIANMMMGLHVKTREVPVVRIPEKGGLNTRFLSPFRGGVLFGAYGIPACHFDLAERKIHMIRVAEMQEIRAAAVVADRAWFAGLTSGRPVLVGIGQRDRVTVDLPQTDEVPNLGIDGRSLLAVYSQAIFRLTGDQWTLVHSGDELLPRCEVPPQLHGSMVFFRDEGRKEIGKRLWWLTLGETSRLSALDYDLEGFDKEILGREGISSYCVTKNGDVWACTAWGTLLRRSQDGRCSIAIFHGSIEFGESLLHRVTRDQGLLVSGVTALPDDTLFLASDAGLYRLRGNELAQELAFVPEEVKPSPGGRKVPAYLDLRLNTILMLDDQSYVIGSGAWRGVYLLRKGTDGHWRCLPVEDLRDIVVW
jgi:hypothetical protein